MILLKYFEIHDPYYALLCANNKEEAVMQYIQLIADDENNRLLEEIKEVSRDYALVLFSRGLTEENQNIYVSEILEQFYKRGNQVLLVDSALI